MRRTFPISLALLGCVPALALSGCLAEDPDDDGPQKPEDDGKVVDGKEDAWNATNNPGRFEVDFIYKLSELPRTGTAEQTPWPDTYWPTFKDSSNQRWQGMDVYSPLEKYDLAFNGWSPPEGFDELKPFDVDRCTSGEAKPGEHYDPAYYDSLGPAAKYWSDNKGNRDARNGIDDDGDGKTDECDDNDGVESWWGLCHAWVPAAILEKEPQHAVTYNGVTFEVGDIKGLLQTIYNRSHAFMLGGRCNEKEVARDEHGRLTDDRCRDTNAGAFHVVVTNMLGRFSRAFAEDRTYDYEVWNQPIRTLEVLSLDDTLTATQANEALGVSGDTYQFNAEAVKFAKVRTKIGYVAEPRQTTTYPLVPDIETYTHHDTYDYIVEMDADGVVIGGEWLGTSRTNHPDFLWLPTRPYDGANPHLSLANVRTLLELSVADETDTDVDIDTFENTTPVDIPDNTPAGVTSTIEITENISIGSLKVELDVQHTYIGDLLVVLEKDGTAVKLHEKTGGGTRNLVKTFDVREFNGKSATGTWTLRISDHASRDVGKLNRWSLNIGSAATESDARTYSSTDAPAIPDDNATGVTSTISVNDSGTIGALKVKLDITHTYIGDLVVTLSHGGVTKTLHSREGGSNDNVQKTFTVDGFSSVSLNGDWVLRVTDNAEYDTGTLNSWSLEVEAQ